jgi:predicted ATP-grasp superfamily ATP-dependent carboligase
MPKVVTFSSDLRIFKTIAQLEELDKTVNDFIEKNQVKTIYSVNDTTTTDDSGSTMGIIRVLAYD